MTLSLTCGFAIGAAGLAACLALCPAHGATESVVYAFKGANGGFLPSSSLTAVGEKFYGTTQEGGGHGCGGDGVGTIFSMTTQDEESVRHSFRGASDGAEPAATLIDVAGTLYGTTMEGGGSTARACGRNEGCGTVSALTP